MKPISLKVLTLTIALATASLVFADTISDNEATLKQIAGYRQWTRINPQPVIVTNVVSVI
jgi:hypothetical protein